MKRYAAFVLLLASCQSMEPQRPLSENEGALLMSVVRTYDPRTENQLLEGFHRLEEGSWRWTKRSFAVLLEPPPPVPLQSPSLGVRYSVPETVIEQLGEVTLAANLNGKRLGSTVIRKAGADLTFEVPAPPELIAEEPLTAEFQLDQAIPAGTVDERELGIIVTAVWLR